jgi:hypothetical protein
MRAFQLSPLALDAAHEARTVEHIANQRAVGTPQHGVAGTGDLDGGRDLVEQIDGRDLVWHGDQSAVDIGQAEHRLEHVRIILGLDAERHHDRIDAVFFEIRIVDHRRLERRRRIAEMRDQRGRATDHFCLSVRSRNKSCMASIAMR